MWYIKIFGVPDTAITIKMVVVTSGVTERWTVRAIEPDRCTRSYTTSEEPQAMVISTTWGARDLLGAVGVCHDKLPIGILGAFPEGMDDH